MCDKTQIRKFWHDIFRGILSVRFNYFYALSKDRSHGTRQSCPSVYSVELFVYGSILKMFN